VREGESVGEPLVLALTHDVDWPRHGPPREHVLARLDRFEPEDRRRFLELGENIYYGIGEIMEREESLGLRSTFFFRPAYDDGSGVESYAEELRELARGGWEVGLHANCGWDLGAIAEEKRRVERAAGVEIVSMRVHMLKLDPQLLPALEGVGVKHDSSLCFSREGPSPESAGCLRCGGVLELPITVMDAYLFAYWGVKPGEVRKTVLEALRAAYEAGRRVATLLWHDCSVRMRGGREYLKLLEDLSGLDWIEPIRVMDVPKALERHGYACEGC
jgi:hypothetical protein